MKPPSWWIRRFGSRKVEQEFMAMWGDLSRYNSERTRGIMHDPSYVEKMAEKQRRYNEWLGSRRGG